MIWLLFMCLWPYSSSERGVSCSGSKFFMIGLLIKALRSGGFSAKQIAIIKRKRNKTLEFAFQSVRIPATVPC